MMDKKSDKKVMTFKSGKFVFSGGYSGDRLAPLLIEIEILNRMVADLPVLPNIVSRLDDDALIKRSIFGTAAIEGNPLDEDKVAGLLSSATDAAGLQERAEKEILNLKSAYDFVDSEEPVGLEYELTEGTIRNIHRLITEDIDYGQNTPGGYRNYRVRIGTPEHGGVNIPPKPLVDIKMLMREFIVWINSRPLIESEPLVRAALAHLHLGLIHPFGDGNGRTARLVEALLLRQAGMKFVPRMLSNYYYNNIDEYFLAFSGAIKDKNHDRTDFLEFVLKGTVKALNEIKDRVVRGIRILALKDFYRFLRQKRGITQRQYDLLLLLHENPKPIKLVDLYDMPPFEILYREVGKRTASRDLKRLLHLDLLTVDDDKSYRVKIKAVG